MAYKKDLAAFLSEKKNAKVIFPPYTTKGYSEHVMFDPKELGMKEAQSLVEDYIKVLVGSEKIRYKNTNETEYEIKFTLSYNRTMIVIIILCCMHPDYNGHTEICVVHEEF